MSSWGCRLLSIIDGLAIALIWVMLIAMLGALAVGGHGEHC